MKYSQLIGIIAALALIGICYLPWVVIERTQLTVTGMDAAGTNFGKPGWMNIILTTISVLLFAIPRVWAKRTNFFLTMLNLAWSIRNYVVVSACLMGECPVKQPALYLLIVLSLLMMVMSALPRLKLAPRK